MKTFNNLFTIIIGIATAAVACSEVKDKTENTELDDLPVMKPSSELNVVTTPIVSKSGSDLEGAVIFSELKSGKVNINVELSGIAPGNHAVHIHEKGDCSAADGKSAGGHWNPEDVAHGNRAEDDTYHKGDIGNIVIGEDGKGSMSLDIEGWTIGGEDASDILNKAVIVHAGPDDFTSQPSGAAGARIGCGVIKK